jgi:hypothetical protein
MAKPIETLSPTDEAIFRTATLKSLQGAAEDPDHIGAEYLPENAVLVDTGGSTVRYLRINTDDSISELSLSQLLSDLTPNRLLYVGDIAASWFNGTSNETIATIPLTADQAVVGTKIRLRGFVKAGFQGIYPAIGDDVLFCLVFNVAADSATATEGAVFLLNSGRSSVFHVDIELEMKNAGTGKYKIGLSSTQIYNALAIYDANSSIISRTWDEGSSSAFVVDPTTAEDVASTSGIVVQLQAVSGITNQSLCNFWMDLNYEITTP